MAEGAWLDLKLKLNQLTSIHGFSVPSRAARSPFEYALILLYFSRSHHGVRIPCILAHFFLYDGTS